MPTEPHHFATVIGDASKQFVAEVTEVTGLDLNTAAINIQTFAADPAGATAMGTFRHNGRHLGSYPEGVREGIRRIIASNPTGARAEIERFLAVVRVAVNKGELLPNAPSPTARGASNTANLDWFQNWEAKASSYGTEVSDLLAEVNRWAPNGVATDASRLLGYSDVQLAELARRYPDIASAAGDLYAHRHRLNADFAGMLPEDFRNRLQSFVAFADTPLGRRVLGAIRELGIAGDIMSILLTYSAAEALYQESLDPSLSELERGQKLHASNGLWARFIGNLVGGGLGALAGLVGGPFAPVLSLAFSIGGSVAVEQLVDRLYTQNGAFADLVDSIAEQVRATIAGLTGPAAEAAHEQVPEVIARVMGGGEGVILDGEGQVILRLEYDPDGHRLIIDRPGEENDDTVEGIDLDEIAGALKDILISEHPELVSQPKPKPVDYVMSLAPSAKIIVATYGATSPIQRTVYVDAVLRPSAAAYASAQSAAGGELVVLAGRPLRGVGPSIDNLTFYDRDGNRIPDSVAQERVQIIRVNSSDGAGDTQSEGSAIVYSGQEEGAEPGQAEGPRASQISFGQIGSIFGWEFYLVMMKRRLDAIDITKSNLILHHKKILPNKDIYGKLVYYLPSGFCVRDDIPGDIHCFVEPYGGQLLFSTELFACLRSAGVHGLHARHPTIGDTKIPEIRL